MAGARMTETKMLALIKLGAVALALALGYHLWRSLRSRLGSGPPPPGKPASVQPAPEEPAPSTSAAEPQESQSDQRLPIEVFGCWVSRGQRTRVREHAETQTDEPASETETMGFLRLRHADVPVEYRVAWRQPIDAWATANARLAGRLWSGLSVHLDDHLEVAIDPNSHWSIREVLDAARRMVAGVHALVASETEFIAWLAATPVETENPAANSFLRADYGWRGTLLIEWYPEHPTTQALARREAQTGVAPLRYASALLVGDLDGLYSSGRIGGLPPDLYDRVFIETLQLAVARGEGSWLADKRSILSALAARLREVATILLGARDPSFLPFAVMLLREVLAAPGNGDRIDLVHMVFELTERLGGAAEARALVLGGDHPEVWLRAERAILAHAGVEGWIEACTATFDGLVDRHKRPGLGDPDAETLLRLVGEVKRLGGPADLSNLRRWTDARNIPARRVRAEAQAAIETIVQRQPREQAGALSVVDGEAGALSAADATPQAAAEPPA